MESILELDACPLPKEGYKWGLPWDGPPPEGVNGVCF